MAASCCSAKVDSCGSRLPPHLDGQQFGGFRFDDALIVAIVPMPIRWLEDLGGGDADGFEKLRTVQGRSSVTLLFLGAAVLAPVVRRLRDILRRRTGGASTPPSSSAVRRRAASAVPRCGLS